MAFLWHELLSRIICYWKSYQHHNRIDSIFSMGSVGTKEWIRIAPCCKSGVYFLISLKIMSKDFFISLIHCDPHRIVRIVFVHATIVASKNFLVVLSLQTIIDEQIIIFNDLVSLSVNYRIYQDKNQLELNSLDFGFLKKTYQQ